MNMLHSGKCGPNKWHMVLGSNLTTNDTLNLPNVSYYKVVNTPKFGSPRRVLRAWLWKAPRLSKKKTLNTLLTNSTQQITTRDATS